MTIPSQFANWLAVAERDGRGGLKAEPPALPRGRAQAFTLDLAPDDDFGDWTNGVFTAFGRAAPDAPGAPLLVFNCSVGTPAGDVTPVTLSIAASGYSLAPPDLDGDGVVELLVELLFTPTGGTAVPIISTRILVVGVI